MEKDNEKRETVIDSIRKAVKEQKENQDDETTTEDVVEEVPESGEVEPEDSSEEQISVDSTDQPDEAGAQETQSINAPTTESPAQTESFEPPTSWSAEAKAVWKDLPVPVKRDALRRELELRRDQTRIQQEYGRVMNNYGGVIEAISPYERELRMRGYTPTTFVNQLLAEKEFEDTNPMGYLMHKMQQYQIDPNQFIQSQSQLPPELQGLLSPLQQKLSYLESKHQQMELAEARRKQAEKDAENQVIYSDVNSFLAENGNNPLLQDPEFQQELGEQAYFLTQKEPRLSPSERLKKAYDRALKLSPKGQSFLSQQNLAKQAQAQKAKIIAARKASSSVSGNASDKVSGITPGKTVNSAVRAAVRKQKAV